MKDSDDLDVFSDEQIEVTRHFEAGPADAALRLAYFAFKKQTFNDILIMRSGLSIPHWQRAAYEAAQAAKSKPEDHSLQLVAKSLWSLVRYIQEAAELAIASSIEPEMVAFFKSRGIDLPKMPDA